MPKSCNADKVYGATAFGLTWASDHPLHDFETLSPAPSTPHITVRRGVGAAPERPNGIAINRGVVFNDGVRLVWEREVVFDTYGAQDVVWRPGPDWTGRFPPSLFSTLTAILMAYHGGIPVHGSTVELDGRAYITCGAPGAGKSTLAAALIAHGARLISDDLSVLWIGETGTVSIFAGRPAIRLHPAIGTLLARALPDPPHLELRPPKLLVRPDLAPSSKGGIPLAGIILRGPEVETADQEALSAMWQAQVFRPRWMSAIPNKKFRDAGLIQTAHQVPLIALAPTQVRTQEDFDGLAQRTLARLR